MPYLCRYSDQRGFQMVELLMVLAIIGLILALSLPALSAILSRDALQQSAINLRGEMALVKSLAIRENRNHGLQFRRHLDHWEMRLVRDDNHNGIRSEELEQGKDTVLKTWAPLPLEQDTAPGYPEGMANLPQVQPALLEGPPVRFGRGRLLTFTPIGNSSSGSIFLMEPGGQVMCLRVQGSTGRISLWVGDTRGNRWILLNRSL